MAMDLKICRGRFDIPNERRFLGKIREIAGSHSVHIVFVDSAIVAGCNHIRAAVSFAERAYFEYKTPISNSFEMEVLLYILGTRQTGLASCAGIHRDLNDSVILICSRRYEGKAGEKEDECFPDSAQETIRSIASLEECLDDETELLREGLCDRLLDELSGEKTVKIAGLFSITPREIEICGKDRIEELVIERCSLLDVNR